MICTYGDITFESSVAASRSSLMVQNGVSGISSEGINYPRNAINVIKSGTVVMDSIIATESPDLANFSVENMNVPVIVNSDASIANRIHDLGIINPNEVVTLINFGIVGSKTVITSDGSDLANFDR